MADLIKPEFGDKARRERGLGSLLPSRVMGGADVHNIDIQRDAARAQRKGDEAFAAYDAGVMNGADAKPIVQDSLAAGYNDLSKLDELHIELLTAFYKVDESVIEAYKAATPFKRQQIMDKAAGREPLPDSYAVLGVPGSDRS